MTRSYLEYDQIDVDNLKLDGNTISSKSGDIIFSPYGAGTLSVTGSIVATAVQIGSISIASSDALNSINGSNLYLWANFR